MKGIHLIIGLHFGTHRCPRRGRTGSTPDLSGRWRSGSTWCSRTRRQSARQRDTGICLERWPIQRPNNKSPELAIACLSASCHFELILATGCGDISGNAGRRARVRGPSRARSPPAGVAWQSDGSVIKGLICRTSCHPIRSPYFV